MSFLLLQCALCCSFSVECRVLPQNLGRCLASPVVSKAHTVFHGEPPERGSEEGGHQFQVLHVELGVGSGPSACRLLVGGASQ